MAIEYYNPVTSYLIYGVDTAWGTTGTPSASNQISKVTNFTWTGTNNFIKSQGINSRNATNAVLGKFDVSGSIDIQVDNFDFFKYSVGKIQGDGKVDTPYELVETKRIGYIATSTPSLTLELGSEGASNDDVMQIDGVVFNSFTLTANAGDILTASFNWTGRSVASSTTLESVTPSSTKPFVFQEGNVTIGSDSLNCTAFSLTLDNGINTHNDLNSRFIAQPSFGLRRYDFSVTFRMKYDDTASILSGTEIRNYFLGATAAPATDGTVTAYALSLDITEGSAVDDRVVNIDLSNAYFETWSNPVALEGGFIECTVDGFALSGLADSTDIVPIRWYVIEA